MDRESLVRASSLLDLLAIGWKPGNAELDAARRLKHWAILPGPSNHPFQIMGIDEPRRSPRSVFVASVIAIDPKAHWARVWDEWLVVDNGLDAGATFDPVEVQRVAAAWLLSELGRLVGAE